MTITDKTRKMLWGRAASRCAICRVEVVMDPAHALDGKSIVGDECHIVAREQDGPRGDSSLPVEKRDEYENLLILCKTHHKLVDDQQHRFTVAHLTSLKLAHEHWVRVSLSERDPSSSVYSAKEPFVATRIRTGGDAVRMAMGADGTQFDNDTPTDPMEADTIAEFLQELQETDVLAELPPSAAVHTQLRASQLQQHLEQLGFVVYGCRRRERWRFGDQVHPLSICYILVFRDSNPLVQRKEHDIERLFAGDDPSEATSNFVVCSRR